MLTDYVRPCRDIIEQIDKIAEILRLEPAVERLDEFFATALKETPH